MANGHGGYREPANPAPASGPGALSQRTDGGPTQGQMIAPGGPYGSRQDMAAIQGGAPMAGGGGGTPAPSPVPLDAPSARPSEPITAGAELGAGPTPDQVGIQNDAEATFSQLQPMIQSLTTLANLPSSTPQFRSFVRKLKAKAGNQQQSM